MQVTKLSDVGGVAVQGVDLSESRTPDEDAELMQLYDVHGLVVFKDQKLTKQQLVDAGAPFGGTMIDPPATVRDPEVPGIVVISTRGTTGDVVPEEKEELVGDLEWHSDQWYVTQPNRGKILYGIQVPEEGGKTGFIDNQLTYEALSDELKSRIEGLHVIQSWDRGTSYLERNRGYRIGGDKEMVAGKFKDVVFPLVYQHPKSEKKILNFDPLYSAGILEIPGPGGDAILQQLRDHVLEEKFQYWHRYDVGDAVLWDNWRFIHASSGTPGKYARTLWSIVIDKGPAFGYELSSDKKERAKARRMALVNAKDSKETLACRICRLYLDYVKSQDVEGLWDLFPKGTHYNGPDGGLLDDPDTIAAGYARGFANMGKPWQFKMERVLPFDGEYGCLLEFGHRTNEPGADFTLSAVDHIEVNAEGHITRFLPFFASTEIPRVLENINKHKTQEHA
ncbi:MAG: TauD/TfdA family dioxygenase [Novosphingobium sp.]